MENQAIRLKEYGTWSEQSSSSGKRYYYNRETEVSQWEKPTEWRQAEKEQERLRAKGLLKSTPNEHSSRSSSKHRHQRSSTSNNNTSPSAAVSSSKTATTFTAARHSSSSHTNHHNHHQNSSSSITHHHHHSSAGNSQGHSNGLKRRRADDNALDGHTPVSRRPAFENSNFSASTGSQIPDSSPIFHRSIQPPAHVDVQTSSNSSFPGRNHSSVEETKRTSLTPIKSSPGSGADQKGGHRPTQHPSHYPSPKMADQSAHSNFSEHSNHNATPSSTNSQQPSSRRDISYSSKDVHSSSSRNKLPLSTPSHSVQNGLLSSASQNSNARPSRRTDLPATPVFREEKYQRFYRPDLTSYRRNWTSDNYLNEAKKCAERVSRQTVQIASIDNDIKSVRSLLRAANLRSSLTAQRLANIRSVITELNV